MLIGLGIIGEIYSIYKTKKIDDNSYDDAIIAISENGYKLDYNKYLELNEEKNLSETDICDNKRNILTTIIPGLNILFALKRRKKIINSFMENEVISKSLVKLTKEEQELYSSLDNKLSKYCYTMFNITKKYDEEEFIDFDNNIDPDIYSYDFGRQEINGDVLLPISYTLDDIKEINDSSSGKYKIGNMNGVNVAIVGIDDDSKKFKRLSFKRDNYEEVYDFKEMDEEEAKDKRFVVYPFIEKDEYDKVIDDIIKKRNESNNAKQKKLVLNNREVNVWKD
ncbi:MAG: hypothetical protein IKE73_01480 [Bacilli bacterium]|nr:hypothetical protein [Bacilli bacterium]